MSSHLALDLGGVFRVGFTDHAISAIALGGVESNDKIIAVKLMKENKRPVNGFPPGVHRTLRRGRERVARGTPEDASGRRAPTMVQARFAVRLPGRSKARARPEKRTAA